jgi:hypothetical protein
MKPTLAILLFAVPVVMHAQARPASCEVRPLWSIKDGVRSGNLGAIGKFETDGKEGITTRSFKMPESNLVISVGIDYVFDYSRRPDPAPARIALAISVSAQEKKDIFESVDSSEASTHYTKDWNLRATKNIYFDDRTYMFTLSCWDGTKLHSKASKAAHF